MISIREYHHPDDYPMVRQLWEGIEKGVKVGRSDEPDEVLKKITRDPDLFLVAEDGEGGIVGSVIGGFDGRRGMLYHLAVADGHRQHGVGSQLLHEIEIRLHNKGCLKCYLMVTLDNLEVQRFYEKRGWHHMDYVHPYGKELG